MRAERYRMFSRQINLLANPSAYMAKDSGNPIGELAADKKPARFLSGMKGPERGWVYRDFRRI